MLFLSIPLVANGIVFELDHTLDTPPIEPKSGITKIQPVPEPISGEKPPQPVTEPISGVPPSESDSDSHFVPVQDEACITTLPTDNSGELATVVDQSLSAKTTVLNKGTQSLCDSQTLLPNNGDGER